MKMAADIPQKYCAYMVDKRRLFLNRRALFFIILSANVGPRTGGQKKSKVRRHHMITVSIKGVLIGVLLIALIVLVVFLIVLVANATDTVKKANAIIDGVTEVAITTKGKVDNVNTSIKESAAKVGNVASVGISAGQKIVDKVIR